MPHSLVGSKSCSSEERSFNHTEGMVSPDGAQTKLFISECAIKKEPDDQLAEYDFTPSYTYSDVESRSHHSMPPLEYLEQTVNPTPSRQRLGALLERSLAEVAPPEPGSHHCRTPFIDSEQGLNSEPLFETSPREHLGSLLEQSLADVTPAISPSDHLTDDTSPPSAPIRDRLPGPTFSPGVLRALPFSEPAWAALEKITAYSRDIRKDPEAVKELIKKVKDYIRFRQLRKDNPNDELDLSGHTDHTYVTQKKNNVIRHYKCSQCGKIFPKNCRHRFLSHMRTHTGERPFKCKVCGRGFSRQDHVQVHMRLHTGEKPFKCTSCNASYAHKVSLKSHKCDQYKAKQLKEKQQLQEEAQKTFSAENDTNTTQQEQSVPVLMDKASENLKESVSSFLCTSFGMSIASQGKSEDSVTYQDESNNSEKYYSYNTKIPELNTPIEKISEVGSG